MAEAETPKYSEGLRLNIVNNTDEDLILQAQKIEKGLYRKGHHSPEKIPAHEEKSCELVMCEGAGAVKTDIEGWLKYRFEKTGGYCKLHFRYMGKPDKTSYSHECYEHGEKFVCSQKTEVGEKTVTWVIEPKA